MILIVDDNEDLRDLFRCVLESEGFTVGTAASGEEALDRLREAPQTWLVLLDLVLPDMSGLDLATVMKAEHGLAEIPVLLVSGMPFADVGALPVLRKPVMPEDLIAAARCYVRLA